MFSTFWIAFTFTHCFSSCFIRFTSFWIRTNICVYVQPPVSGWEAQEQHLLEMFPKCSLSEARSALSIAKGDMEEAVRLIIEGDVQLSPSPLNVNICFTQELWHCVCCHVSHFLLCVFAQSHFSNVLLAQVNQGKSISSLADQKLKESILEKWVRLLFFCGKQNWPHFFCFSIYVSISSP